MGVAGGDLGTGRLTEVAILMETAPLAEVAGGAKVAYLVEVDPRTVAEVAEARRGVDRGKTRAAPGEQRRLMTPFWPSCVRWEKCSGNKWITCDSAETAIAKLVSRSTGTFRRLRPRER